MKCCLKRIEMQKMFQVSDAKSDTYCEYKNRTTKCKKCTIFSTRKSLNVE